MTEEPPAKTEINPDWLILDLTPETSALYLGVEWDRPYAKVKSYEQALEQLSYNLTMLIDTSPGRTICIIGSGPEWAHTGVIAGVAKLGAKRLDKDGKEAYDIPSPISTPDQ